MWQPPLMGLRVAPSPGEEGEKPAEQRPLLEVFTTVLLFLCCCSQCGDECCGYKGLLLSHAGSLKSKSYLAVSKATTCGIIKKDEVLLCQIEGILAWREHFVFICLEDSNVFLPAKLRRRNGGWAVQVIQDNSKNSENTPVNSNLIQKHTGNGPWWKLLFLRLKLISTPHDQLSKGDEI